MAKKSGKAGKPVPPVAPDVAEDADVADPGEVADIKVEQARKKEGKYGAEQLRPHKPDEAENEIPTLEEKTSWIEIELVGEDGKGIPGERYEVVLPDGKTAASGTLDGNGLARIEGIESGTCKVRFPGLDEDAVERKP